ncbi:MAG: prepilin-type N-terminal cleavage/methylation domain-containing protein [Clostridia bacterium]|nr:prepilin-type N-terminal cleavage/methylation domain-containing protein [Clostridia bacterium]
MKKQTGITLIALVITIIVLLILAGTVISMSTSGDGIFTKANETVDKWNEKVSEQDNTITGLIDYMDQYMDAGELVGKYIYYEPTGGKFVIASQNGDTVTLNPVTFPSSYEYTLSGAYKIIGGVKKSVNPSESGAQIDATYEELDARIKAEQDAACTELFAGDPRIISAINTRQAFEYTNMVGDVNSIIANANGDMQNIETNLAAKIEEYKSRLYITDTQMDSYSQLGTSAFAAAAYLAPLAMDSEEADFNVWMTYTSFIQSVYSGETAIESLDQEEQQLARIGLLLQKIASIDFMTTYWIYGTDEWLQGEMNEDPYYAAARKPQMTPSLDWNKEGYDLLRYGPAGEETPCKNTKYLAPVVIVNVDALEENEDGTYTIPTL